MVYPDVEDENYAGRRLLRLPFFHNLDTVTQLGIQDLPVESFLISESGLKALRNMEVRTLGDLRKIPQILADHPGAASGLGGVKQRKMQEMLDYYLVHRETVSLRMFMETFLSGKEIRILDLRTGLTGEEHTLEEVSTILGVTRERIRQIEKKSLMKLDRGIRYDLINPETKNLLLELAEEAAPIRDIALPSSPYGNSGVVRLYCGALKDKLCLYNHPSLSAPVLTSPRRKEELDDAISRVRDYLKTQISKVEISQVMADCRCNRSVIETLNDVLIEDGKVALRANKRALGLSPIHNIKQVLREAGGPLSLTEISQNTGYGLEKIRNIAVASDEIANVGQSIYALKSLGYLDTDTGGVMKHVLNEAGAPIPVQELIDRVKKYKIISDSAVYRLLTEKPEIYQQLEGGLVALREWGYLNEKQFEPRRYVLSPSDAVMGVLEESEIPLSPQEIIRALEAKYGADTSTNPTTIYAVLRRLEEEGVLEKVSEGRTVYYELA